jgi:iron complex outermembrane receptor protein
LGAEIELTYQILKMLQYQGNVTYSINTIEGENGTANKQIAFSPSVVSSSMIHFKPLKSLKISWLQKYVGEQYLSNAESETSKLSSYMTHDLNVSLEYLPKSIFKSIQLNGLINNVMNKKYVSNGADYGGGAVYYYPQAGINFLVGLTLNF